MAHRNRCLDGVWGVGNRSTVAPIRINMSDKRCRDLVRPSIHHRYRHKSPAVSMAFGVLKFIQPAAKLINPGSVWPSHGWCTASSSTTTFFLVFLRFSSNNSIWGSKLFFFTEICLIRCSTLGHRKSITITIIHFPIFRMPWMVLAIGSASRPLPFTYPFAKFPFIFFHVSSQRHAYSQRKTISLEQTTPRAIIN